MSYGDHLQNDLQKKVQIAQICKPKCKRHSKQRITVTSSPANSRKILHIIIDTLFVSSPMELSTVEIANRTGLHPGLVGAILTRSPWATRRHRVRINRNKRETRWAASDAALIDYARRNAALTIRKAAMLATKGITSTPDSRGRITLRCGSITSILHVD